MSDSNSSSIKAYTDSAIASGQSMLGKITGSAGDKVRTSCPPFLSHSTSITQIPRFSLTNHLPQNEAAARKSTSEAENDASHTVGKIGPVAASSSGGVSVDDPDRSEGSWNQTVGSGKEALGGLLGAEGLKREGQQQNAEGKAQEAKGQLNDFGSGVQDRLHGEWRGEFLEAWLQ